MVVDAMNHSSWDELLEIRSSVFLMKEEEGTAASATAASTAASARSGVMGAADSISVVGVEVTRSDSAPSHSSPNSSGASEQPAAASLSADSATVSAEGSAVSAHDSNARGTPTAAHDPLEANAEHSAEAAGEESDSDIWKADLALGVAKMVRGIVMNFYCFFALLHLSLTLFFTLSFSVHRSSSLAQAAIVPQWILMLSRASRLAFLTYKLCFRQTRPFRHQNSSV